MKQKLAGVREEQSAKNAGKTISRGHFVFGPAFLQAVLDAGKPQDLNAAAAALGHLLCSHQPSEFVTYVRKVEPIIMLKNCNAVNVVRGLARIRVHLKPCEPAVPFTQLSWPCVRDMNIESATPGFQALGIHTFEQARHMLDGLIFCLKGVRTSSASRAHVNTPEFYDLGCWTCEFHGLQNEREKKKIQDGDVDRRLLAR